MPRAEQSQAEKDFTDLLSRLADKEPKVGFSSVNQLPALTDEDLGVILDENPGILADAMSDELARAVSAELRNGNNSELTRPLRVGVTVISSAREIAKRYLLRSLITFCDTESADGAGWAANEAAAREAGVPARSTH